MWYNTHTKQAGEDNALRVEKFTHIQESRNFVAELSDFGRRPISTIGDTGLPLLGRIYPDACDVGMTLVNHKTGGEATFFLAEQSEEILELRPTTETLRKYPALKGYKITLFND